MERNVIVRVIGGGFLAGCIQSTEPTPNVEATDRPTEFVSVEATIVAQISALEATNDTTITAPTPSLTVLSLRYICPARRPDAAHQS